ncbi:MAG TPA: helix-turn-helix transcriptional regulator [Thermoanaerobaculia bacterium]|nr:helix-turn-helix transcriptional regulator [Thermoanaerobaculia bacterium]
MPPFGALRVFPFERLLFAGEAVAVGTHRLPAGDPRFESYGPTSAFFLVFPRTCTMIEHAGGPRFVGSPAVAPLYNAGQEYRRRRISDEGDFCDWFAIAPSALREVVGQFDPAAAESDRPLRFPHVGVEPRDYLQQRAVVERLAVDTDPLLVEEIALTVLGRLLGRAYRRQTAPVLHAQEELARAADVVLGRTFARNLPLSRIARETGSSPYHLARSFKRTMGITLHQRRLLLRLHASLAMLRDTSRDLSTIALDLGFADHSHFTMAFRRRFGVTPSSWRGRAISS